jgi:hypothetical protein
MIKLSHKTLIVLSGFIWMGIGCMLLSLGINFLVESALHEQALYSGNYPVIDGIASFAGGLEQAALVLVAFSLLIGYLKGRYVLGKSAYKGVERIRLFSNPTSLTNIYSAKYYILLAAMVGLGMSVKFLGLPVDVRGMIDVAIGSALINGAMIYFRLAFERNVATQV